MSKIISLGKVARPCSANVIRSSEYLRKQDSISCARKRACLARLESNLFRAGFEIARAVENSPLPKTLQAFPNIDGVLHYYHSDTQRKFVFLDFELGGGGGGGKSVGGGDDLPKNGRVNWIDEDPPLIEDIAARHVARAARASDGGRNSIIRVIAGPDKAGDGAAGLRSAGPDKADTSAAWLQASPLVYVDFWASAKRAARAAESRAMRLLKALAALLSYLSAPAHARRDYLAICGDLVRIQSLLHGAYGCARQTLPSWSVLRKSFYVSEQLENEFARKILIGEFACRLRLNTAYRFRYNVLLAAWPGAGRRFVVRVRNQKLYEETRNVLGNLLRLKGIKLPEHANFYRFVHYADKDCLADDRVARLARSEMTYHLAGVLLDESAAVDGARRRFGAFGVQSADYALLRKFALFSDFIALSDRYFGLDHAAAPVDEEASPDRRRRQDDSRSCLSALDAERIGEFGDVASLFARQAYGGVPERGGEAAIKDDVMKALHDRLLAIVSDLLESNGAAGPRRAEETAD